MWVVVFDNVDLVLLWNMDVVVIARDCPHFHIALVGFDMCSGRGSTADHYMGRTGLIPRSVVVLPTSHFLVVVCGFRPLVVSVA